MGLFDISTTEEKKTRRGLFDPIEEATPVSAEIESAVARIPEKTLKQKAQETLWKFDASKLGIAFNTLTGLPKASVEVGKNIAQYIARTVGTVGITAGDAFLKTIGQEPVFGEELPTKDTKIGRALFGGEPIRDIPTAGKKMREDIDHYRSLISGKPVEELKPLRNDQDFLIGLAGVVFDLSGLGGGKLNPKALGGEIPEQFFKFLAKEGDEVVIENTFRNIGLKDEKIIKDITPLISRAKTVDEVKTIILDADKPRKLPGSDFVPEDITAVANEIKAVKPIEPDIDFGADAIKNIAKTFNVSKEKPLDKISGEFFRYETTGTEGNEIKFYSDKMDYVDEYKNVREQGGKTGKVVKEKIDLKNPLIVEAKANQFSDPSFEKPFLDKALKEGNDGVVFRSPEGDIFIAKITKSQITDLSKEAKKYKSAEEFMESQGTPVYHGTDADFAEFDVTKAGKEWGGKASFFTTDKELAQGYGKNTIEAYVKFKNPKIITSMEEWGKVVYNPELLQKQGYDGVVGNWKTDAGNPVNIQMALDSSQIKTKAQLTEIYNKANKAKAKKPQTIEQLREELKRTQFKLEAMISNKDVAGIDYGPEKIKEFQEKVTDLKQKIADMKFPKAESAKEVLKKAEERVGVKPVSSEKEVVEELTNEQIQANEEYTDLLEEEGDQFATEVREIRESKLTAPEKEHEIEMLRLEQEFFKDSLVLNPARQLHKFSNKRTGELPEVLGKGKKGKFASRGDEISQELGFADSEEAREAYQDYIVRRKKFLEQKDYISKEVKNYREKKQIINAVEKQIRAEGRSRMAKIKVIQDFFQLTDGEMKKIMTGNPDLRLITDEKFEGLLKMIEEKAHGLMRHNEAVMMVEYTILDKELKKTENLLQALKLQKDNKTGVAEHESFLDEKEDDLAILEKYPATLDKMSVGELERLDELLQTFQKGDEFLGPRQIQTAKLTDLGQIMTKREALDKLAQEAGVPIQKVQEVRVSEIDPFLYDVAFARRNPLYKIMVQNENLAQVESGMRFSNVEKESLKLAKEARLSRKDKGWDWLVNKIVPTDKMIWDYLSADAQTKIEIAKDMSPAELKYALFVQKDLENRRDFLLNQGTLNRYRMNYITHIRRSFLEALKESGASLRSKEGLKALWNEIWDANKLQRIDLNIVNDKTGDVLPLEKFFKFALERSDKILPTKNVAKAHLAYARAFEKKRQLDSFVAKLDIYSHVLTPTEKTEKGLIKDDTLRVFIRKWLNTKRGRPVTIVASPGGKIDTSIRAGIATTRLIDLGLNLTVGLASNLGAQVATYTSIGSRKYAKGAIRALSKKGTEIGKKYDFIVGKSIWDQLGDASKDIGDKSSTIAFGLFSDADRRAKKNFLLGSMTDEEFKTGEISQKRLSEIRMEMGRYHVIEGMTSVFGKTAEGQAIKQYKGWAVPLMNTTIDNLTKVYKTAREGKNPFTTKEGKELRRTIQVVLAVLLGYKTYLELKNDKNRTFLENLAYKSMNDALSVLGSLSPAIWLSVPRLASFVFDLSKSLTNIVSSLATGDLETTGENLKKVKEAIEPKVIKQFDSTVESSEEKVKSSLETSIENAQVEIDKIDPELSKKIEAIFNEAKDLGFGTEEADALLNEKLTSDDEYQVYKAFKKLYIAEKNLELMPKVLPIVQEISNLGFGTPEADALLNEKITSQEEYDAYKRIKQTQFTNPDVGPSEWDEQSFLEHAKNLVKGWTADPVTAFDDLIHGDWKIVELRNGQIIVERMPLEASQAEKSKAAKNNADFKLDHIIPLKSGGTNRTENLQIISTEQWKDNTEVENYISRALKDEKITGEQAREYIIRYKSGQYDLVSEKLKEEYEEKYGSIPLSYEEIKNLIR